MASALPHHSREADTEAAQARHALERARSRYFEDPAGALVEAIRCHELGCSVGDASLCASARALQGSVSLHRGDCVARWRSHSRASASPTVTRTYRRARRRRR